MGKGKAKAKDKSAAKEDCIEEPPNEGTRWNAEDVSTAHFGHL